MDRKEKNQYFLQSLVSFLLILAVLYIQFNWMREEIELTTLSVAAHMVQRLTEVICAFLCVSLLFGSEIRAMIKGKEKFVFWPEMLILAIFSLLWAFRRTWFTLITIAYPEVLTLSFQQEHPFLLHGIFSLITGQDTCVFLGFAGACMIIKGFKPKNSVKEAGRKERINFFFENAIAIVLILAVLCGLDWAREGTTQIEKSALAFSLWQLADVMFSLLCALLLFWKEFLAIIQKRCSFIFHPKILILSGISLLLAFKETWIVLTVTSFSEKVSIENPSVYLAFVTVFIFLKAFQLKPLEEIAPPPEG